MVHRRHCAGLGGLEGAVIASWLYLAVSALCMAAVAGRLIVFACNAWTNPDRALGSALKFFHHGAYVVRSLQYALAHYRHVRDVNRPDLAQAMLPVRMEER